MLNVCTLLWDANQHSQSFSRAYSEVWVERLFRGFRRNLSRPFRFVCYVDRERQFFEPIEQIPLETDSPSYADCIRPFELNEPSIIVGLDTVVTGKIDHLADYCEGASKVALPRDPYMPQRSCNGVCLVPAGQRRIYDEWNGENDMEWLRGQPHDFLDDIFPGHVVSFKGHVKRHGLGDARIVYFHGREKMHEISVPWVAEHWR